MSAEENEDRIDVEAVDWEFFCALCFSGHCTLRSIALPTSLCGCCAWGHLPGLGVSM